MNKKEAMAAVVLGLILVFVGLVFAMYYLNTLEAMPPRNEKHKTLMLRSKYFIKKNHREESDFMDLALS